MNPLAIYIHVPVCACCDFASFESREGKPWAMQGAAEKAVEF